jgi:transcription elongation factor Elf1
MSDRQTSPTPTCQPVRRGWGGLPCPMCGEAEVSIALDLDDMGRDEACRCAECESAFGLDHVRDLMAKWQAVLLWLDSAPMLPAEQS